MALKEQRFRIYKRDDFIRFVPEMVDELEVYSVVNSKDQHCGYITSELLDFLIVEDNEERFLTQNVEVRVANNWSENNKLCQKIILDAPQGYNRNYFPSLILIPTQYVGDEPRKALKLTANKEFVIMNYGGGLALNFNNNLAEVDKFHFFSTNTATTTLNINLPEGKAKSIFISELKGSGKNRGDVVFNFASKGNDAPLIEVSNLKIEPMEDLFNKRRVYPFFKISGDTFKAVHSVVSLPSILINKDSSSLFEIRSSKGNISLTNSDIMMFEAKKDEISFLEVKKDINLTNASVSINGAVVVEGNFQSSALPKQSKKTSISLTNTISQSSLVFKPKNSKKCDFAISNSTLDNGSKSIFLREEVVFMGVDFKNEPKKDITFADTEVKYSNLFNVSNLSHCTIYKTHVENFNFISDSKNDMVFVYGQDVQGMARSEEDKKITSVLKNTQVELNGYEYFRDRTSGSLNITNCVIKGTTTIDSTCKNDGKVMAGGYYPVNISNSILTSSQIACYKDIDSNITSTSITNSEIKNTLITHELESIDGSLINNSSIDNVLTIKGSVIENENIEEKKVTTLDNYNSAFKNAPAKVKSFIDSRPSEDIELI